MRDSLRRRAVWTLGAGFAFVASLLVLLGVLGLRNSRVVYLSAVELARERAAVYELINRIQRGQVALRLVVHRLTRDPSSVDESRIMGLLQETDEEVQRAIAAAEGSGLEDEWERFQQAAAAFRGECLRVLALENPEPEDGFGLFQRQEDIMFALRAIASAGHEKALEAQQEVGERARRSRQRTLYLLATFSLLAAAGAVASVRTTLKLFSDLAASGEELSRVSGLMLEQQEAAARRFSHELHDELGQTLAAAKASVGGIHAEDPNAAARRADALELIEQAIGNVRELSQLLHPTILDHFGLAGALRWLGEGFATRTGIEVQCDIDFSGRLPDDDRAHLFRIAQEALTNVSRHAKATRVHLSLRGGSERAILTISDNGQGFVPGEAGREGSLGLLGMRARARLAGGELRIRSQPGRGTAIEAECRPQWRNDSSQDAHLAG